MTAFSFGRIGGSVRNMSLSPIGAILDIDLVQNRVVRLGREENPTAALSFSRSSVADWLTSTDTGLAAQAAANILRRDNRGALIEQGATAHGCNSSLLGLAPGTPGTLPSNWAIRSGLGLTRTLATTTINGVQYLDIAFSGTTTSVGSLQIQLGGTEGSTAFPILQNEPLNTSALVQVVQDHAAVTALSLVSWCFAGTTFVGADSGGGTSFYADRLALTRANHQRSITSATTTNAVGIIVSNTIASGTPVAFTLRLGLPQMTKTAAVTSPILTGTSALSRASDALTIAIPGLSAGSDWTVAGVARMPKTPANTLETLFSLGTDVDNRLALRRTAANTLIVDNITAGSNAAGPAAAHPTTGTRFAFALRRSGASLGLSLNGAVPMNTTPAAIFPVGAASLVIGGSGLGTGAWNGFIERVLMFPTTSGDAGLQASSTLATWGG